VTADESNEMSPEKTTRDSADNKSDAYDVSIIVPTLNEADNIGRLLSSIRGQKGISAEIVVVDQTSDDGTVEVATSFGAKVISVKRSPYYRPPSQSRNIGARASSASIIAHLDADMELESPYFLQQAIRLIGPETEAVILHERDVPKGFWSKVKAFEREFYVGSSIEAARLCTRHLFDLVGGYDEAVSSGEDFDLHARYRVATRIAEYNGGFVLHHTGQRSFLELLQKKYSYGRASNAYLKKSTSLSSRELLNAQIRAFLSRLDKGLAHPVRYGAMWLVRALEAGALVVGLVRSIGECEPREGIDKKGIELLLVSPTTVYGSWGWFAELIVSSPAEWSWTIVTYGRPPTSGSSNVRFLGPRRGNYIRFGRFLYEHPYLAFLNPLWYIPLTPYLLWAVLRRRPALVIGNGILASAVGEIIVRGRPVVLVHHVYLGYIRGIARMGAARAIRNSTLVLTNSDGGAEDIIAISDGAVRDLKIIPMWASDEFFEVPLQVADSEQPIVTYVGRCDPDKSAQTLRVGGKLAAKGKIQLHVVGDGELLASLPEHPNIHRHGYIADRYELAQLLSLTDLVWAPCDTTYMSRPAWEGLAAGAKLLMTDHPAAGAKVASGIRVRQSIIPLRYGKVVSGDDDREAYEYLSSNAAFHRRLDEREACRSFALQNGGAKNRQIAIKALAALVAGYS